MLDTSSISMPVIASASVQCPHCGHALPQSPPSVDILGLKRQREGDAVETFERDRKAKRMASQISDVSDAELYNDWLNAGSQLLPTSPGQPAGPDTPINVPVPVPDSCTLLAEIDFSDRPDLIAVVDEACHRLTKLTLVDISGGKVSVNCFEEPLAYDLGSQVVPGNVILFRRLKLDKKYRNGISYDDTQWALLAEDKLVAVNSRLLGSNGLRLDEDEESYARYLWRWYHEKADL